MGLAGEAVGDDERGEEKIELETGFERGLMRGINSVLITQICTKNFQESP